MAASGGFILSFSKFSTYTIRIRRIVLKVFSATAKIVSVTLSCPRKWNTVFTEKGTSQGLLL